MIIDVNKRSRFNRYYRTFLRKIIRWWDDSNQQLHAAYIIIYLEKHDHQYYDEPTIIKIQQYKSPILMKHPKACKGMMFKDGKPSIYGWKYIDRIHSAITEEVTNYEKEKVFREATHTSICDKLFI